MDVFVISDADDCTLKIKYLFLNYLYRLIKYISKYLNNLAKEPIIDGFSTYGRCLQDTFQVWSAGSTTTPIICGTNSGYHCNNLFKNYLHY